MKQSIVRSRWSTADCLVGNNERTMSSRNSKRIAYKIEKELKYTRVKSRLRRRKRNRASPAIPMDRRMNPMPTPASSQRNSERTEGVRSIAKEIDGFICPWLYVVRWGKATCALRTAYGRFVIVSAQRR